MENLKKFRKAKGLNQDQLAEIVGVSASAISQYENGRKTPSFETALKLAEALDCESADLVSKRGNINPAENKKTVTNDGDGDISFETLIRNASERERNLIIKLLSMSEQQQDAFLTLTQPLPSGQSVQDALTHTE